MQKQPEKTGTSPKQKRSNTPVQGDDKNDKTKSKERQEEL